MYNLFKYVGIRHLQKKPIRTLLTTLGIALGVALFIAISIINRSTLNSFKNNIDAIAGKATLSVFAGESGFPEEKLEIIQNTPGVRSAVPLIETRAYFAGKNHASETITVLGVDLLKEQAVRTYKTTEEQVIDDPLVFLNQPDSIIITHVFAKQHELKINSVFYLATVHGAKKFTVRGMLSPEGPAKAYGGAIAIMDIDGARVTFGKENLLDRVDVVVTHPDEDTEAVIQRLKQSLGAGYSVERPETHSENVERMVKSYQSMLTFFSTLALLVGIFLVMNSISIAVAERKREIGTLRALGATRLGVLTLFLSEATAMGGTGALVGTGIGKILASFMVNMVQHAMSIQYLTKFEATRLEFGASDVFLAVTVGAVASFFAALWPAYRATQIQPLVAIQQKEVGEEILQQGFFRYSPYMGMILLLWVVIASYFKIGYGISFCEIFNQIIAIVGSALLGPSVVIVLIRLFHPLAVKTGGTITRLAEDNLLRNPKRTAANVLTLTIGLIFVMMVASVKISFKTSILDWFSRYLQTDLIVSSNGRLIAFDTQPLHENVGALIAKVPGVKLDSLGSVHGFRFTHIPYQGKRLGLKAYDESDASNKYLTFVTLDRNEKEVQRELFHSQDLTILVSNNFVFHFGKKTGDIIELATPSGTVRARIIGVMVDYASSEGVLYMSRVQYKKFWKDPLVNSFGINVESGFDLMQVKQNIDHTLGQANNLMVVSNAEFKKDMEDLINQSFAYTRAVEWAALLVGLLGLFNTILISVLERTRELGTLRAIGTSKWQLSRMVLEESLIQGGFGALSSVFFGTFLAYLWIKNNLAHLLGWIVDFHFPWISMGTTVLIGTTVALLAGLYPAQRAAKLEITEALEYE